jgi:hypothetical protein
MVFILFGVEINVGFDGIDAFVEFFMVSINLIGERVVVILWYFCDVFNF